MTQHFIITKQKQKEVEVQIGWDRPMQNFYLVVQTTDEESDEYQNDEYVYTNLFDKKLLDEPIHRQDIGYFKRVLENLEIKIPEQVFQEVLEDKKHNVNTSIY